MTDLFLGERVFADSPKQLTLREIGVDFAMEKNEIWHSRLPKTDKSNLIRNSRYIFYGAEFLDHCFAVAIWTTPVARKLNEKGTFLELRRLAIAPDAPKFTATWMIAKMIKDIKKRFPEVTKLYSYQDTEVHTGTIYAAANWTKETVSKGSEWSVPSRSRPKAQSTADKIRWAYEL
jgi:hypothetical protein